MQDFLPLASYANFRLIHISCAVVSVSLFLVRGSLQLRGYHWRAWPWLRVLPHCIDTLLLGAAITLVVMGGQYPWEQAWLGAKVVALLAYIALGSVALGKSSSMAVRKVSFVAALLCVTYLVCVAHTRSPLLGFSY